MVVRQRGLDRRERFDLASPIAPVEVQNTPAGERHSVLATQVRATSRRIQVEATVDLDRDLDVRIRKVRTGDEPAIRIEDPELFDRQRKSPLSETLEERRVLAAPCRRRSDALPYQAVEATPTLDTVRSSSIEAPTELRERDDLSP